MSSTLQRLTKLRELMKCEAIEAWLITHPINRKYVTGFTGSAGYVLLTGTQAWLLTDFRYMTQAKQQLPTTFAVVQHDAAKPLETIAEIAREAGIRELHFEQDHVSVATFHKYVEAFGSKLKLIASASMVEQLRQTKDAEEIAHIRHAVRLADEAFAHILQFLKPGMSEREVALELELHMRRAGATAPSFEIIVASGERSALPHGIASDRCLSRDEFVKMDYGAIVQGYCSDLTRTIVIGKPSPKHLEIYEIVLAAQQAVLSKLRAGMTGREADALARSVIDNHGYGDYFGHGTGHSLGLEIHEQPRLSKMEERELQVGNVVTVEPGIYLPEFGGVRIEDMVIIQENGCEILTQAPKQLICL
jgi:Xaa-Pro aminopeptidase